MSPIPTAKAVSAGGVVFRQQDHRVNVVLILVGPKLRWQLPKGTVNPGEKIEQAAQREVREEAGVEAELIDLIERIEYWFYATHQGRRTRFHKYVYFYLMRFCSGDVNDHDHEVEEARWIEINQAIEMLAFDSEREMVRKTRQWLLDNMQSNVQQTIHPKCREGNAGA